MTHQGSCHCGRIQFDVDGEPAGLVECNCSHCSRKGYLLWFVPRESLHLRTSLADMATYTFNKHAIEHHFCPTCGCAPMGLGKDDKGNVMVAVNARCLPDLDRTGVSVRQVDGRSL